MKNLEKLRDLKNQIIKVEHKLWKRKHKFKVEDKVQILKFDVKDNAYKIEKATISRLNPKFYDSGADFKVEIKYKETLFLNLNEIAPIS